MMSIRLPLLAVSIGLTLAACSGSPSEADVRQAAAQQLDEQQKAQTALLGSNPLLDEQLTQQRKALGTLKLIGCKSDGEKAYNCDVEIGGKALPARLVKGSHGWMIAS